MPLSRFTIRQFEAFVSVTDARGFSAAAQRLGLTPQAVSQLVAEFEMVLGFRLFDRTTRRVTLTAAGRDFLGAARAVLSHVSSAEAAALDLRNLATGTVRLGAPQVLAAEAVPAALRDFAVQRPRVSVHIRDLPVDGLTDAVIGGDVDLAVGPDRPVDPEVRVLRLFDTAWVLWCAPSFPLARRRRVTWAALRGHPLVAAGRDHELSVAQMHRAAPTAVRVEPVAVVDSMSTALGMAAQGLAGTLAPGYVGAMAARVGLTMRRVHDPEVVRTVCLYLPRRRPISPAVEGLAEHLVAWMPNWGAKTGGFQ